MIEPSNKQTGDVTVVPAAVIGYAVLSFPNRPTGKASIANVVAAVQENLLPVIAWKLHNDCLEPLTVAPTHIPDTTRYLVVPGGKIFALDDPSKRWHSADQFHAYLHQVWLAAAKPEPEMVPLIPGRHAPTVIHA